MKFRAFVLEKDGEHVQLEQQNYTLHNLPEGEVTVKVAYSSVNYKDGLAALPKSPIVRSYPFIPGIDLAGTVVSSNDERYKEGDEVIVTSYELGVSHFGGYSEYANVKADWIIPLPAGLSLRDAMAFGTAGLTAALAIQRLEDNGLTNEKGPVLVTGATGGVGSLSVAMLADLGYEVYGSTGKLDAHEFLKQLGATDILGREDVTKTDKRPLGSQRWAAAIDPVGGDTLSYLLSTTNYGGSVALMGLAGGADVATTVHPFILRGVNLLGIDSVYTPYSQRLQAWDRLASDLRIKEKLEAVTSEITLDDLPTTLKDILAGKILGRKIVKIS